MNVYSITDAGVEQRSADELTVLLKQPDTLIWVDIPVCLTPDAAVLLDLFGFHEHAVRDCVERNHISKIHFYDDHVFTVLHAPDARGDRACGDGVVAEDLRAGGGELRHRLAVGPVGHRTREQPAHRRLVVVGEVIVGRAGRDRSAATTPAPATAAEMEALSRRNH
jgi:Mg2+ and Co2+ transporter CorA